MSRKDAGIERGIRAAGYVIASRGVFGEVAMYRKRCGFFGCKSPIRAGELHVTVWRGSSHPPESMHLGCASKRCWLRPARAIDAMNAAGGLWTKADEVRDRAGLPPIAKAS